MVSASLHVSTLPPDNLTMLIIHQAKPLIAWEYLEDSPSLKTVKDLLAALPSIVIPDSLVIPRGFSSDRGQSVVGRMRPSRRTSFTTATGRCVFKDASYAMRSHRATASSLSRCEPPVA